MIRLLYTLLLLLAVPLLLPSLYRNKPGKPTIGKRWKEHFGQTPPLRTEGQKTVIWIHAVSVGEVVAATPLIKQIHSLKPELQIVVTTTTATGAKQAEGLSSIAEHRYMPLDFGFAVRGFLNTVKPKQLIIIETELWPNTLATVKESSVPITVVNARLSEKSFNGYRKVQPLINTMLPCIDTIICQHTDDANRFKGLGFSNEQLTISGSIKFDIYIDGSTITLGNELRHQLGSRPIWIAASTHQGEDEQVLHAHKEVLKVIPDALLILVPRHPERFKSVAALAQEDFATVTRTSKSKVNNHISVYLADTMGEMLTLIGASDVCFMGGSLIGNKVGGHNLLEPAALAKPTLTGPSYFNFTDITSQLVTADSCQVINSEMELSEAVIGLLRSQSLRSEKGNAALHVVNQNRGALKRTIEKLFGDKDL